MTQHRERTYIFWFDKKIVQEDFEFSFPEQEKEVQPERMPKLKGILAKYVDDKYTLTDNLCAYLQKYAEKHKEKWNWFGFGIADQESYKRTLSARYYKDGSEILIAQKCKNPRKLTKLECARLIGFPETFKIPVSDMMAYNQLGNSIIVPVVYDVAQRMVKVLNKYYGPVIKTEKNLEYLQNPV